MKFNYDSMDMKLDEEAGYTTNEESVRSEHEVIDPVHAVNTQSFEEELSSEEDLDEWVVHKNKQIRVAKADLKKSFEAMEDTINNDSFTSNLPSIEELNPGSFLLTFTINNYNSYAMANIEASNNVMPRSIYECYEIKDPTEPLFEHSELGEKANVSESLKLQPFRPRPCVYSFDERLKVKIRHTNIYESDQEIVFNQWILANFDVEYEYAKEIGNPYS
ncbi:hypothetical protein Tco_1041429 [Tanacetum coccineum]|uniref:Uncharacterized protein n=1 Tax=Tanacetum coccineum TaxID=301880 RepID=A0ABQ5GHS8_9ASTR